MIDVPDVVVESSLPEGWVPEGAGVYIFARQDPDDPHQWEAVVPEFSVAGMGDSPEAAAHNAIELLEDYLLVCARDGRSFEECVRPLGRRSRILVLGEAIVALTVDWLRSSAKPHSSAQYRVPLRGLGAHSH
jgi:hypothetical protein